MTTPTEPYPGQFVTVLLNGKCFTAGNKAIVFMVERGLPEPLYGLYSYERDSWELMERSEFMA